jgi:hypothetical protein
MLSQRAVHERLLAGEAFNCATTRPIVIVESRVGHFRIELGHRSQPRPGSLVPRVLRFTQHKLSTRFAIGYIEPVAETAEACRALPDDRAGRPSVHAADDNVCTQMTFAVAGVDSATFISGYLRLSSRARLLPGRTKRQRLREETRLYAAPFRKSSLDEQKAKVYIGTGSTDTPRARTWPYAGATPAAL